MRLSSCYVCIPLLFLPKLSTAGFYHCRVLLLSVTMGATASIVQGSIVGLPINDPPGVVTGHLDSIYLNFLGLDLFTAPWAISQLFPRCVDNMFPRPSDISVDDISIASVETDWDAIGDFM